MIIFVIINLECNIIRDNIVKLFEINDHVISLQMNILQY